ncbi:hypothetical protein [Aliiruegeria sabulilitoris]|uniref:hypothetical protein n=1 Tax=Aliiruegeria sabulilitoris TaxID=1510458 RepID=UPI000832C525|nr:hypothetical protein [Aliiruegeria sabulilitoris]NDR58780.1 hypothetical protein [Pseudoruegeria sp. M32A2M]
MALKKTIARLNDYQDRLKSKEVDRIKVGHVEKIIAKLEAKDAELLQRLDEAKKPEKKERLKAKQKIVRNQIARARWLRKQIKKSS